LAPQLQKIIEGKFVDPKMEEAEITRTFRDVEEEVERAFQS
jgi:hypothetical protein